MMEEESGTPEDSLATQIIEGVLGDLQREGLELIVAFLKAGEEEEEINNITIEEVPQDGGQEESEQEVVEGKHDEGEEIDKA